MNNSIFRGQRTHEMRVGYRVRTGHATGTIVEVNGDKYLVDLDGQEAQLWEKGWGMSRI